MATVSHNDIETYFGDTDPYAYCKGMTQKQIEKMMAEVARSCGERPNMVEIRRIAASIYNTINR